jgi:hypothetical protein
MGTFAETAIVNYRYRWPTKEHKRPFFAETKWKLPFSLCGIPETWRHEHGNMET